jgi:predicted metal-dependent hydrolase
VDVSIVRSQRKTLAIQIVPGQGVKVRAPRWVSRATIDAVLAKKGAWIQKHFAAQQVKVPLYTEGERFWYLGAEYPLVIVNDYARKLQFSGQEFLLSRYVVNKAKSLFTDWYIHQAKEYLTARAQSLAHAMNLCYQSIRVTRARTRWGSCSSAGTISFSYRLMALPPEIIEYVVVHELAHLNHHNHSKNFWAEVHKYYPEFKKAKQWLYAHGAGRQL